MPLKIVHFSVTALAGGPYRLVHALQSYTDYEVRLIDLRRWDMYAHDLIFSEQQELCIEAANQADVIHFHNYLDLNSRDFAPIDFKALAAKGTQFVRQFRSEPGLVARRMGQTIDEVVNCPLPSLAIAQYPERFYPNAMVVPNNLPINEPEYLPTVEPSTWDIIFTPTKSVSAWGDRWNTKGAPETIQMLNHVARQTKCAVNVVSGRPLAEVLAQKRLSYVNLDDMVTGSYHISALEGLSMAKPTLTYLDSRIERVLREISGATDLPFINVRLEDADKVLLYLLGNREDGAEIGRMGRQWVETYWSEAKIAARFKEIYQQLLQDPTKVCRQASLRLDAPSERFFSIHLPDLVYRSRAERSESSGARRVRLLRTSLRKNAGKVKRFVKARLPASVARYVP